MITVLVAEDHLAVRDGLRMLLDAEADLCVVGEAGDGASAVERALQLKPDVVVLDLTMPGMSGLAAARALRAALPSAGIVVLTRHNDRAYVRELFAAGASAYVLKHSSSRELLEAIRAAAAGGRHLDSALRAEAGGEARVAARGLTDRERDVLRRMAVGQTNKEIASALGISVKTVEVHKANAMRKLNLAGRTDVLRYAALEGWLKEL